MKYKLIIFDADGTLFDTIESFAFVGNNLLKQKGKKTIDEWQYRYFIGEGPRVLVKKIMNYVNEFDEEQINNFYIEFMEEYAKHFDYNIKLFPGIKELIENLKREGIHLAISTNKPQEFIQKLIDDIFPKNTFSHIIGYVDNSPRKPDPSGPNKIMNDLNIKREETIYIGDSKTDVETAKNAKVTSGGVLWGFREEEELLKAGADIIFKNANEIYEYIKK